MVLQNKNLWIGVLIIGLCLREVTPCWYDSTSDYASLWELNKDSCGTLYDNGKIVGGDGASVISWPWLGFLEKDGGFICTVELIAWNWATTAAHCVDDGVSASQLKITFGQTNKQWNSPWTSQVRNVDKIIAHSDYIDYKNGYDIALLRLDAPIFYDLSVRPVCMSYPDQDDAYDNCYVAGWGKVGVDGENPQPTDQLQELKVELQTNAECQARRNIQPALRDEHICADRVDDNGNPVFGGTCNGDSGGPLMCQVESSLWPQPAWLLVGITSFGTGGCGNVDYFDVFTRASKFNQWITDCVDANGGPFILNWSF